MDGLSTLSRPLHWIRICSIQTKGQLTCKWLLVDQQLVDHKQWEDPFVCDGPFDVKKMTIVLVSRSPRPLLVGITADYLKCIAKTGARFQVYACLK